jgi:hypothetical protein
MEEQGFLSNWITRISLLSKQKDRTDHCQQVKDSCPQISQIESWTLPKNQRNLCNQRTFIFHVPGLKPPPLGGQL